MNKIRTRIFGVAVALSSAIGVVLAAPLYAAESDADAFKGEVTIISEDSAPATDWIAEEEDSVIITEKNTTTTNNTVKGGDADEAPTIKEPVVSPLESSVVETASTTETTEYAEESTTYIEEESVEIASEETLTGATEEVFEEDIIEGEVVEYITDEPVDIELDENLLLGDPIDAIRDEELSEADDIEEKAAEDVVEIEVINTIDDVEVTNVLNEDSDIVENTESETFTESEIEEIESIEETEEAEAIEEVEEIEAPNYEEYGYFFVGGTYDVNKLDVFIVTPSDLGSLSPEDVNLYIYMTSVREDLEACYITDLEGNVSSAYSENFISAAEYAEEMLGGRKLGKSTVESWIFEGTIADDGATYEEYVARFEALM